jgi:hypothetical protein
VLLSVLNGERRVVMPAAMVTATAEPRFIAPSIPPDGHTAKPAGAFENRMGAHPS